MSAYLSNFSNGPFEPNQNPSSTSNILIFKKQQQKSFDRHSNILGIRSKNCPDFFAPTFRIETFFSVMNWTVEQEADNDTHTFTINVWKHKNLILSTTLISFTLFKSLFLLGNFNLKINFHSMYFFSKQLLSSTKSISSSCVISI